MSENHERGAILGAQDFSPTPIRKSELPPEISESLEQRIIPIDILGIRQEISEESLIPVYIIEDDTLSNTTGEQVATVKAGILICNGLLLARGWIKPSELKDYGGKSGLTLSGFWRRMNDIKGALVQVTGLTEPIERTGKANSTKYRLHPSLVFMDKRQTRSNSLLDKVRHAPPSLEDFQPGSLEFIDPASRRTVFSSMLNEYMTHPQVKSAITLWMGESDNKIPEELSAKDLHHYFSNIDKGLVAYLAGGRDSASIYAIQEAIAAYHAVYSTLIPSIEILANSLKRSYPRHKLEFFQAAAMENVRLVQEFECGLSPESCQYFYASAQLTARGAMLTLVKQVLCNEKGITRRQYERSKAVEAAYNAARHDLNREPTTDEVSRQLEDAISPTEIRSLLQISTGESDLLSLDDTRKVAAYHDDLAFTRADIDLYVDQWSLNQEAQRPFDHDSPLNNLEKMVLSLYFELFSPHLCGKEYNHRYTRSKHMPPVSTFVYPHTAREFRELLRSVSSGHTDDIHQKHVASILGGSPSMVQAALERAIDKSRVMYAGERVI